MKRLIVVAGLLGAMACCRAAIGEDARLPADKVLNGPHGLRIVVRAQGPYDADVPLQVVCYFKHKGGGDKTQGAPVELDKRLGGVIAALRDRGEFVGDEQETLLLAPPKNTIKPALLLLVGLGDEADLSTNTMERVGRTAQRFASQLGIKRVAFAPLLRDQGNDKLSAGEVETAVIRGALLAYDTNKRLQSEGLAREYTLEEWVVEAGPAFFRETVSGVEKGLSVAERAVAARVKAPFASKQK
jgi:leucyl aminopeptidase